MDEIPIVLVVIFTLKLKYTLKNLILAQKQKLQDSLIVSFSWLFYLRDDKTQIIVSVWWKYWILQYIESTFDNGWLYHFTLIETYIDKYPTSKSINVVNLSTQMTSLATKRYWYEVIWGDLKSSQSYISQVLYTEIYSGSYNWF
jgi:hypothetical protein